MPLTKQTKRYRGLQRIILRKLVEVVKQIEANAFKYPEPPTPNRRRLAFTLQEQIQLTTLRVSAANLLDRKWPEQET